MEYITLYNRARSGAIRIWQVALERDKVTTKFGQKDGVLQTVVDYGYEKNVGKANFISAERDAENLVDRLIREKKREGYREELEEVTFDPFDPPEMLRFYKPQNSLNSTMEAMIERNEAWAVRKYDGEMMVLIHCPDGEVRILSRKMHPTHHHENIPWSERFSHIAKSLKRDTPRGTILLGEMVGPGWSDDRWLVAQVLKSLTPRAIELQREHGPMRFRAWDVAWWGMEQLIGKVEYRHRYDNIDELTDGDYLLPAEVLVEDDYSGVDDLRRIAAENRWEGFVIVNPCDTYGDRGFNLRGKPDRPSGCCKLKPFFEDDFVAIWDPAKGQGKYGRGKYTGQFGACSLYQIDSKGKMRYICECGNGFTAEFIRENSAAPWQKVIQVRYESRTYESEDDETNALQFPRFMMERTDKSADECVNPRL